MTDAVDRLNRTLSDRYRIDREIGEGGMATVYLAHDLKHDRNVALKVLKPELGAVLGVERFLSEIKVTANLQHPNLLPLFDSGEAEGLLFYVMPFVEGETLRARLEREKQLPVDDAVRIAAAIASALAYAHERGVIHRDLKPENILMQAGQPVIADFGIALAVSNAGGARVTQTGLSLGTPQYMSPEQATGDRAIDGRTDIYSLGAMTYEMLVGDPPHTASTAQAIVAKVLTEKPPSVRVARSAVSDEVAYAVEKALEKLPADRWSTAQAFADALQGRSGTGATTYTRLARTERVRPWSARSPVPWAIAFGVALFVALLAWNRTTVAPEGAVQRFELNAPAGFPFAYPILGNIASLALSPDGRQVVFTAAAKDGFALAIRSLDQFSARLLPGTEGAVYPEFSPDGRWIAFGAADGTLRKIATDGTSQVTLCKVGPAGSGGLTWLSDREIVFTTRSLATAKGMYKVSADGGEPVVFSRPDSVNGERLQLSPRAVDGGRFVLYGSSKASSLDLKIGVVRASDGSSTVLPGLPGARPIGLVNGMLVYVRADGALMAVPLDPRTLKVGVPIQVGDSVAVRGWDAAAALAANGTLVYQKGGVAGMIVRVDERGAATRLIDAVQAYQHPRLSPDGRRLAFEIATAGGANIWTIDLGSKTFERLTSAGFNDRPEWTPDGTHVMYTSSRTVPPTLWWQPSDGSAAATMLHASPDPIREGVFSPDGRWLVYRVDTRDNNRDILMVPMTGERTPVPLLVGVNDDKHPRVSPDSKWLAYVSNESGREEVYVRALAAGGGRVPVSAEGGGEPLWSRDGKRLFYRSGAKLIAAAIATTPALAVTNRQVLFEGAYATDLYHANYDVTPDGKGFIMVRPAEDSRRLVIVLNWVQELQQRLGPAK